MNEPTKSKLIYISGTFASERDSGTSGKANCRMEGGPHDGHHVSVWTLTDYDGESLEIRRCRECRADCREGSAWWGSDDEDYSIGAAALPEAK